MTQNNTENHGIGPAPISGRESHTADMDILTPSSRALLNAESAD